MIFSILPPAISANIEKQVQGVKNLKELLEVYGSLAKVKLGYLVVVSTMVGFYLAPGDFVWSQFLWASTGMDYDNLST
jgi:heme O synthase-like polyprenyltransferase